MLVKAWTLRRRWRGLAGVVAILLPALAAAPGAAEAPRGQADTQPEATQPESGKLGQTRTLIERLERLKDKRRVLLIFAPSRNHEGFGRQRLIAQRHGSEFRNHDIVVLKAAATGGHADRLGLTALRERFDVAGDSFTVILLAKDGEPLLRSNAPVEGEALLAAVAGG